jgi:hypothetical protein
MRQADDAVSYITDTLKGIFNSDYKDVLTVRLYCHFAESVLISLINANRIGLIGSDCLATLNQMVDLGLLSTDIPSFFREYQHLIGDSVQFDAISDWGNAHTIYEYLLSRELNIFEKGIWFSVDKISRNNTGSYYTPSRFALEVVREAIAKYLKANEISSETDAVRLLAETKFADLSCGCGEFIKAVRAELVEQYHIDVEKVSINLYGIDIDPIALQITVCDLLENTPQDSWREVISHFTLGNPLIDQPDEKDFATKTRLFAIGRFYNFNMGISINQLFTGTRIDIVLGNPPWEKVRFEERKFFKPITPDISVISQKNKRQTAIEKLKTQSPICYNWYMKVSDDYTNYRNEAKKHPYLSKSLNGELNTSVLFTELSLNIIGEKGILTLLVKSSIATSPANKPFFTKLTKQKNLTSICLFNNSFRIFDIDSREQFCVITCTKKVSPSFEVVAGATTVEELHAAKRSTLTAKDVSAINPHTQMLPNITKNTDIQILLNAHKRLPLFDDVYPECHYGRLVHLTSHAHHIDTTPTYRNLPIYEGKFIERYDLRFATFAGLPDAQKYSAKAHAKKNISKDGKKALPECRYFIQKEFWNKLRVNYAEPYMLCWRSLTSPTNARTTLAMLLPTMPTCQSIQFLQTDSVTDLLTMLALLNSKPFDYLVRLKMPGIDLTQSVVKQIPVPSRETYQRKVSYSSVELTLEQHIINRVTAILSRESLVASLLQGVEFQLPNRQNDSKITLEKDLDNLLFWAYGFSDAESYEIRTSFKK